MPRSLLPSCPAHLCIVLYEEEEDYILPQVLNGKMERVGGVGLEHIVQKGGAELSKVTGVQVVL